MALTGTLHLYIGLAGEPLLVLNGLGYYTFILALYLPTAHHLDHEFVSGQFMPLFGDWVGMLDKLIEIPLIWLLLMQLREIEFPKPV